jgi:hypothetical protein
MAWAAKRKAWRLAASALVCVVALSLGGGAAQAQVVGSVGAVSPLSVGTPPGEKTRSLILGSRVIANERIETSGEGTTNILFLDRTSLFVGRNSTLIIDKYVYDPDSGRGVLTATMVRGVMRFIGGQISHTSGVRILTPVATIGVRGGMMTVSVGPGGTTVMSHYGHIDVGNGRSHQSLLRSGFTVHVAGRNESIAPPVQTSLLALNEGYQLLTPGARYHRGYHLGGSDASRHGFAYAPLPNDPDSMPGLDTVGIVNLGQTFVANRAQQQQWNGAKFSSRGKPPTSRDLGPTDAVR